MKYEKVVNDMCGVLRGLRHDGTTEILIFSVCGCCLEDGHDNLYHGFIQIVISQCVEP